MTRRRTVVLASAVVLLALGLVTGVTLVAVTQTSFGQNLVRDFVQRELAARIQGRLYVGRISGGLLTGVHVDSLEMRGPDDSLFVATGRLTIAYDPRDLLDRRLLVAHVRVEHPFVHIKKEPDGTWNYRRIFPRRPSRPTTPGRSIGDFIMIDSATVRDGAFLLTLPWNPADSLRGARRDSAVREALARRETEIRRAGDGFTRTWRWTDLDAWSSGIRLAHPDSAGRLFRVARMDVVEHNPPFRFRNLRADVRHLGDSVWLDIAHFDLPASTGSGRGKVVWGSSLPIR
ncbi:MAG TPA: hypothetical protein VFY16_14275, partial [Gemmatimonadaceae bacterium]|nr:hypothetical protein [Gemmatimonadaceae bacterium]